MPIPIGARQVPGSPNRVTLPSGDTVTRARALTLGAQQSGFRNHNDYRTYYRSHGSGDEKFFRSWLRTEQGQESLSTAKDNGLSQRELKQQLINARNSRPHGRRPAGQAYLDFMDDYDLHDAEDWIDY